MTVDPTDGTHVIERFSRADLEYLAGDENQLTRRELRARRRAIDTGQLKLVDNRYVPNPLPDEPPATTGTNEMLTDADGAPLPITSADVLSGSVSATTGMTRRQLRELAARHAAQAAQAAETEAAETEATETPPTAEPEPTPEPAAAQDSDDAAQAAYDAQYDELEPTEESPAVVDPEPAAPPQRVSTKQAAQRLQYQPVAPGSNSSGTSELRTTARRPVVPPAGGRTVEHTGEFDPIRRAMRDINAASDGPPNGAAPRSPGTQTPARRSVFEAVVPSQLRDSSGAGDLEPVADATDWTTATGLTAATDNVLPQVFPVPEVEPAVAGPEPETVPEPVDAEGDRQQHDDEELDATQAISAITDDSNPLPDWQSLTQIDSGDLPAEAHSESTTPKWLTALQWVVIIVAALVLGVLVWYAVSKGFGDGDGGNALAALNLPILIPGG